MLLAIMGHFGVPAADTLFVGNHPTDRQAAGQAGTAFAWAQALFGPPHGAAPPPANRTPWDAVEFQRPAPPRRPPG
jgi:FMN phosphatase YigB (HAD superfamily)